MSRILSLCYKSNHDGLTVGQTLSLIIGSVLSVYSRLVAEFYDHLLRGPLRRREMFYRDKKRHIRRREKEFPASLPLKKTLANLRSRFRLQQQQVSARALLRGKSTYLPDRDNKTRVHRSFCESYLLIEVNFYVIFS